MIEIKTLYKLINWSVIPVIYNLTEQCAIEFKEKIDWFWIRPSYKISLEFINHYQQKGYY